MTIVELLVLLMTVIVVLVVDWLVWKSLDDRRHTVKKSMAKR